jgi:hypothetical protein
MGKGYHLGRRSGLDGQLMGDKSADFFGCGSRCFVRGLGEVW